MSIDLHCFVEIKMRDGTWIGTAAEPPDGSKHCNCCTGEVRPEVRRHYWHMLDLWPKRGWPSDVDQTLAKYGKFWRERGGADESSFTYVTLRELITYIETKLLSPPETISVQPVGGSGAQDAKKAAVSFETIKDALSFIALVSFLAQQARHDPENLRVLMFWE